MNDTIIDTINNTIDTIAQVTNDQIVETTSENWNYFASFWGYWLPAILIIGVAIFFRRFMFTNSSVNYNVSFETRDKTKDVRIRNIYVILAIILALCQCGCIDYFSNDLINRNNHDNGSIELFNSFNEEQQ